MPELVACTPMGARMTEAACAKMWKSSQAQRPEVWHSKYHCFTCPIGAERAGATMASTAPAQELWRTCCPRCRRFTTRLIMGRLCVSCRNRQLEAEKGLNAKKRLPREILARLHPEAVTISDGQTVRVARDEMVYDLQELIIVQAMKASGPITFSKPVAHDLAA
jgi:hypothetical protein